MPVVPHTVRDLPEPAEPWSDPLPGQDGVVLLDAGAGPWARLPALAAEMAKVGMAALVWRTGVRSWQRVGHGFEGDDAPRHDVLCRQVLLTGRSFWASDVRSESRCAADVQAGRLRHGPRFYAGVPVRDVRQGSVIGCLSVFGPHTRPDFDAVQLGMLERLAELAADVLGMAGLDGVDAPTPLVAPAPAEVAHPASTSHEAVPDGPVACVVWDADLGAPLQVSSNVGRVLGELAAASLGGQGRADAWVHADDRAAFRTALRSHKASRLPRLEQAFRLAGEGPARWIQQIAEADYDAAGRLAQLRTYLFDRPTQQLAAREPDPRRERLALALDAEQLGTWDLDCIRQERSCNERTAAILGCRPDELAGSQAAWLQLVHPYDRARLAEATACQSFEDGVTLGVQYRVRHQRGHYVWVESHARVVSRDARGQPRRIVGTLRDISHARRAEQQRLRQQQLLALVQLAQERFAEARDLQAVCRAVLSPLLALSGSSCGYIGWLRRQAGGSASLVIGPGAWANVGQAVEPDEIVLPCTAGPLLAATQTGEAQLCREPSPEAGLGWAALASCLLLPIAARGEVVGLICLGEPGLAAREDGNGDDGGEASEGWPQLLEPLAVTLGTLKLGALQAGDPGLVQQAGGVLAAAGGERDPLTGLWHRETFEDKAGAVLEQAQRERTPLCLALFNLDHLGACNETHGVPAGDKVLRRFTLVLQAGLRDSDLLARLEGDTFVALLPDTSGAEAAVALERVRAALAKARIEISGVPVPASVSASVADWEAGEATHEAALERAQEALLQAKAGGRNRWVVAPRSPAPGSLRRMQTLRTEDHSGAPVVGGSRVLVFPRQ